ncbi:MAG: DUF1749 domain-containing protein [Candidatus Micrarchaeota archaeon]|nr:DUF1749 domain-containing protein [Candidatus Micrarchaeota archaeon]MDE1848240.1 DUF1749 domain-containing protein [Candidatus Micrarchaeota archaeon]MDE1864906.1 DUF1749 domain-containing protein [Candidatus Micrarchaeota archaeon]
MEIRTMAGEIVEFGASDGVMLHGFLTRPKKTSNRAVIHLHGMGGNMHRVVGGYDKLLSDSLNRIGYNFFVIETRGSAIASWIRRYGKGKRRVGGTAFEKFEESRYDIDGAILALRSMGIKEIILEGHSTGCQKAIYYQFKARNPMVKGIILIGPGGDYNLHKKRLGKRFAQAVRYARGKRRDKLALMPKRYYEGIVGASRFLSFSDTKFPEARIFDYESGRLREFSGIKTPVLAILGSREEWMTMPAKSYMKILEGDNRSDFFGCIMIRGANHTFKGKGKELAGAITGWLKRLG